MKAKRKYRQRIRVQMLKPIVSEIRAMPNDKDLGWSHRTKLSIGWGNIGYSASFRYLQHLERVFKSTSGDVLECGSGATTLLLALMAEKFDRQVWAFEHHEEWCLHMRYVVAGLGLKNVRICYAPLTAYDGFDWYSMPRGTMPTNIDLVACDGPPGDIRGGRYGLLPVMHDKLTADCRILLDDTHRKNEQSMIRRWASERKMGCSPIGKLGTCTELAFI